MRMTWKELKARLEAKGVRDEDEIVFMDVHFDMSAEVVVERDPTTDTVEVYSR